MGYCDPNNMMIDKNITDCPSGYDSYYNSCCNRSMYVFWNTIAWLFMCGCCVLCLVMMSQRMRQARSNRFNNQMQNVYGGQPYNGLP